MLRMAYQKMTEAGYCGFMDDENDSTTTRVLQIEPIITEDECRLDIESELSTYERYNLILKFSGYSRSLPNEWICSYDDDTNNNTI